jgi:hypothetical protein
MHEMAWFEVLCSLNGAPGAGLNGGHCRGQLAALVPLNALSNHIVASVESCLILAALLLLLLQGELAAKTGAAAAGQLPPEAAAAAAAAAQAQLSGSHRHIAELLLEQVRVITSCCCCCCCFCMCASTSISVHQRVVLVLFADTLQSCCLNR